MSEAKKSQGVKLAKQNLRQAWSSPAAKIGVVVLVLAVIGLGGAAIHSLRGGTAKAGVASAEGYGGGGPAPRGATDAATAAAVAQKADEDSAAAKATGTSFAGPFVFEGAEKQQRNEVAGFDEKPAANVQKTGPIFVALREKAAEYDAAERRTQGGTAGAASTSGARAGAGGGQASTGQAGQGPYGLTEQEFAQVAGQLKSVGSSRPVYSWSANGIISKPPASGAEMKSSATASGQGGVAVVQALDKVAAKEQIAARAGDVCGATPESAIDTDYAVPVFFEIVECGVLTGARARGQVVKSPDDFTIHFTNITLDPKKGWKLASAVEAMAVNIAKEGSPGVADSVNRHWMTRLGSSALLSLAKTEKGFISARGSTTLTTGTSTSTAIEPLSAEEKRTARIAGVLEGSMDIVAKDLSTGVNRTATMRLEKTTLLGIQFMGDVKVVPNE
ncbi:hypothetical protein [Paracidovorax wautersii]|uniref:Conjugation TrbI-like protein n=1 Tax=Paracidovorax wautersii TaxID=1177982 RepID=A0A1I2HSZ1_9BURK|nr:hypothetical protein [Paracidovorax wautersii]SFF31846.1 conjugation TrbI-like protein [Paracidovorax wautersii]